VLQLKHVFRVLSAERAKALFYSQAEPQSAMVDRRGQLLPIAFLPIAENV
jgi:hypothetical protein